jgi:hypothetical protein
MNLKIGDHLWAANKKAVDVISVVGIARIGNVFFASAAHANIADVSAYIARTRRNQALLSMRCFRCGVNSMSYTRVQATW